MWRLVLAILLAAVMLSPLLSIPFPSWAQAPPAPPPTCEVQLADAQKALIQLRKSEAQFRFQSAALEEVALGLQERVKELTPKPTEEKKPK